MTQRRWRTLSLRFQVLAVVSSVIGILFLVLTTLNYQRELAHGLGDARSELQEEAVSIFEAVTRLRDVGGDRSIQDYVNAVAAHLDREGFQSHAIRVQIGSRILQSGPANAEFAIDRDSKTAQYDPRSSSSPPALIVARAGNESMQVEIRESAANIRTDLWNDFLWECAGSLSLATVAAVTINLLLATCVIQPVEKLASLSLQVSAGDLTVRAERARSWEITTLSDAFNHMVSSLAEGVEEDRRQMAKARSIQENLLPQNIEVPGLAVAYLFVPIDDVAGDYFDILPLTDGEWLLCIADVAGHGVPAALGAAVLKVLLRSGADLFGSPSDLLHWINGEFEAIWLSGNFATCFVARWSPARCQLTYASAGHDPIPLFSAKDCLSRDLGSTGIPLGVSQDAAWDSEVVSFDEGDALLLVTDGAAEARNLQDELYGRDRLKQAFMKSLGLEPQSAVTAIHDDHRQFRGSRPLIDDLTVAIVQPVLDRFCPTIRVRNLP